MSESINVLNALLCLIAGMAGTFSGLAAGLSVAIHMEERKKIKYKKKKDAIIKEHKMAVEKMKADMDGGYAGPETEDTLSVHDMQQDPEGYYKGEKTTAQPKPTIREKLRAVPYLDKEKSYIEKFFSDDTEETEEERKNRSLLEKRTTTYISDTEYECAGTGQDYKQVVLENQKKQDDAYTVNSSLIKPKSTDVSSTKEEA